MRWEGRSPQDSAGPRDPVCALFYLESSNSHVVSFTYTVMFYRQKKKDRILENLGNIPKLKQSVSTHQALHSVMSGFIPCDLSVEL